jgi:E3 SUMO-protein ligase RanBP2
VVPQQIPQMPQDKPAGPKSSLLEALNSPSVLNTWTNTFNASPIIPQQQAPPQIPVVQPIIQNKPVEKAPPVNVVITSSDPLPAQNSFVTQPPLSVTIPPQHIKNFDQSKIAQQVQEKPKEVIKVDKVKKIIFLTLIFF